MVNGSNGLAVHEGVERRVEEEMGGEGLLGESGEGEERRREGVGPGHGDRKEFRKLVFKR